MRRESFGGNGAIYSRKLRDFDSDDGEGRSFILRRMDLDIYF